MSQTNVKNGPIVAPCGEDLSNATDRLVVHSHDASTPVMNLPATETDLTLYLVLEGNTIGENGNFQPLDPAQQSRIVLKGTCNPGDILVLADPTVSEDAGKIIVLPADPGTYRGIGIAEEQGVDGQLILIRPATLGLITVT